MFCLSRSFSFRQMLSLPFLAFISLSLFLSCLTGILICIRACSACGGRGGGGDKFFQTKWIFCIACKSTCLAGNLCVYSKAAPPTGDIGRGAETGLSGITIYSRIAAATLAVVVLRPAHRSIRNRRQRTAVQGLSGGWKPILQSDILWWHRRSLTKHFYIANIQMSLALLTLRSHLYPQAPSIYVVQN